MVERVFVRGGLQSGRFIRFTLFLLMIGVLAPYIQAAEKLTPPYKRWLDHDVVYLISKDERDAFLHLNTNDERDQFIQHWWDIRNPDPGAPTNAYKDEIYKRLAYVNQWYSTPAGSDNGWRTERGRVYIQLGPPKQKNPILGASQTKPMEIWFYENVNPALPPYFYILFYQKDIGGDFKVYSPYFDGPDKLTTTVMAVNDRASAFKLIDNELGREVARTTLSLVPSEPVDTDTANSSMESDVMLSILRNLPNHPLTKEMIKHNADMVSSVSHRIVLSGDYLDVLTTTLRDPVGDTYLSYLLRVKKPVDFAIIKSKDQYYYNADVLLTVRDEKDQVVMTQKYVVTKYLSDSDYNQVKSKLFGVEGVLPLPPGKYKAEMILTNKATQSAWKLNRELVVDGAARSDLAMSQILAFSDVAPTASGFLPFSLGGLKFTPQLNDELTLAPDQPLTVLYQFWYSPGDPKRNAGKTIHVEYTYGRLGAAGNVKKVEEDVSMDQFDPFGSMTTGKKLSTVGLPNGNYRLLITATDPDSHRKIYGSLSFQLTTNPVPASWDTYDDAIPAQYAKGEFDLMRGHALEVMNRRDEALSYVERAYRKNNANENLRDTLAEIYFQNAKYDSVIHLYDNGGINQQTSESTVLNFAQSFAKTGKVDSAVKVLESALLVKTPSEPLYLALSTYYEQLGDSQKSAELKKKMQSLK